MRDQNRGHDKDRGPSEVRQSQEPDKGHVTGTGATTGDYSEGGTACPVIAHVFPGRG